MFAERKARVFSSKDATPLQFGHDLVDELIERGGEIRRHQDEAVASALNKPFFHDIGDHRRGAAGKEVSAGDGDGEDVQRGVFVYSKTRGRVGLMRRDAA